MHEHVVKLRGLDLTGILLAVILSAAIILPLLVVGVWAFTEVWRYPSVMPQQFGLRFWEQTLNRSDVWNALWLSLTLSAVVTLASAIICLPAAYAFARMRFPGRDILFFRFWPDMPFRSSVFWWRLPPSFCNST